MAGINKLAAIVKHNRLTAMDLKHDFVTINLQIKDEEGFIINYNHDFIVYYPLRHTIIEITGEGFEILTTKTENSVLKRELEEDIYSTIIKNPLIELLDIPTIYQENNVLGLALTTACNLRCSYCHAEAGLTNKKLDEQIIDDSINQVVMWSKENNQDFYLIFTGSGEPTYNWSGFTKSVLKAKKLCKDYNISLHISMATNGVYGNKIRNFILNNFNRITLSIDGPSDVHNANRKNITGQGSFDIVFETAKFFWKNKFPFRLRSTISSQHAGKMVDIYDYFQTEFPGIKISFEPLNPIGRGINSDHTTPTDDEFATGYLAILKKYGSKNVSYSAIPSIHKLRKNFCSPVARPNVNISVDGKIHACSRANASEYFVFGEYEKNERQLKYFDDKIQYLNNIETSQFSDCNQCFAKYHCAGDCHDLRQCGYFRCGTNRSILFSLIKEQLI